MNKNSKKTNKPCCMSRTINFPFSKISGGFSISIASGSIIQNNKSQSLPQVLPITFSLCLLFGHNAVTAHKIRFKKKIQLNLILVSEILLNGFWFSRILKFHVDMCVLPICFLCMWGIFVWLCMFHSTTKCHLCHRQCVAWKNRIWCPCFPISKLVWIVFWRIREKFKNKTWQNLRYKSKFLL